MNKTIGIFNLDIQGGGWPIWIDIAVGEENIRFSHSELSDLKHLADEAIRLSLLDLPEKYHKEIL